VALVRKLDHIVALIAVVPDLDERSDFSEKRMVGPGDPHGTKN
jgi:hypothetical protein